MTGLFIQAKYLALYFTIIFSALIAEKALGAPIKLPSPCPEKSEVSKQVQVQTYYYKKLKICYISIDPMEATNLIYRSYMFGTDGMFMVFNSFGPGGPLSDTGARVFYFFPRFSHPSFQVLPNGVVEVSSASGLPFQFDPKTARVKQIAGSRFLEDNEVKPSNNGGLEILSHPALILDLGFMIGESPKIMPQRQSTFRDGRGNTCVVSNKDLFIYRKNDPSWDYPFRYKTDASLKMFLDKRCPQLTYNSKQ